MREEEDVDDFLYIDDEFECDFAIDLFDVFPDGIIEEENKLKEDGLEEENKLKEGVDLL